MPKIPTFTSRARLTGEAASVTSNIQIDPRQNIASALRPIGKAVEDYYVKEKAIETKVKAGELNADATVEIFNAAEQAELKSTPQDGVDYFNNKFKTIKEKYKAQASNKNVANTFDILLSQNKNVYVNNILKKTRTNLVTTRVDQVDQRVKSRIAAAVASESQFEFDILAKSIEEDYQGLVNDGIIGKKDLEIYRQKLPALIETQMVKNKAINNAFGALVLLDDNKKYPNIKGDEREKLRTELRQIATFQGKVVDFATNKILLESKKKVAAALAGDEADKFFGINPDEIDQYYTGNEEYDNQINNLNNKIINNEISLDNNYLTNDKIINKILNNEIKNSYEKFKLTGETEAKSITERIGDGSVNLDDDNFFNNIFESQQNPELNKTNKEFFGFIDKVVPLIEGSTSSKYFDNNYNNRLSSFRQDMYGRFVEGLKQNIPVAKLLDSLSDNYIAKDILDYAPTKANVRDALSSFAQEQEPELINTYFKKNENETPTEYLKRIEGNTSSLSLDAKPVLVGLANYDKFFNHILEQEGTPFLIAKKAFADEDHFTLGFGRNNKNIKEGETITLEKAKENLHEDIDVRLKKIQIAIPNFSNFSEELQIALFGEYFRGSVEQSIDTLKLINANPPKFKEAAVEFLDNDEYRDAKKRDRGGIRPDMENVARLLRLEGTEEA